MNPDLMQEKAYGAMLGLAMGDALGFPAMYHRTFLLKPRRRTRIWEFSKQADEQRINKFSLPYTHSQHEAFLHMCGTDDTEFAVVSALILSEAGSDPTAEDLFAGWKRYVVDHGDAVWSGISERASIENAKKGLLPPASGNDNPHHFDDGAVARAVPIGVKYHGQPEQAAAIAERMASITNAADGLFAAKAMAACVAAAMENHSPSAVVEAGVKQIPADSWLGRKVRQARDLLDQAGSGFGAVPLWNDHVVNGIYNYGNVAPETLAVAFAVFLATEGRLAEGLQLAALMPKQADSMPAMVGALAGARQGASAIPAAWVQSLDTVKGICLPHLKDCSIRTVTRRLLG